jgi:hypothetical protein
MRFNAFGLAAGCFAQAVLISASLSRCSHAVVETDLIGDLPVDQLQQHRPEECLPRPQRGSRAWRRTGFAFALSAFAGDRLGYRIISQYLEAGAWLCAGTGALVWFWWQRCSRSPQWLRGTAQDEQR